MSTFSSKWYAVGFLSVAASAAPAAMANSFDPTTAQDPLFLSQPVRPLMMLNMSNDHQLYFKLYDDYTDLDEDGRVETTYDHSYNKLYYGYFDSETCYVYDSDNGRFNPDSEANGSNYCNDGNTSNQWSGNFLNWATMTRMDAVRKILYGGKRSTDSGSATVLERAFLPNDAHSFAKYYNGNDLDKLTPFSSVTTGNDDQQSGITICNTTQNDDNEFSQNVDDPPVLRVAQGNFSLWASNERWQCLWQEDVAQTGQTGGSNGENGNDPAVTGIPADDDSPSEADDALAVGSGEDAVTGDFSVRVKVCAQGYRENNCTQYPDSNFKPTGLLQQYGEGGEIKFGLLTGSYGKNKSGGVLRKNIGTLSDEINVDSDGTFKDQPDDGGIIGTLNRLRLYGYDFNDGLYDGGDQSDNCDWGISSFDNGDCSNWGNPQSEIFLESLRYLAGGDVNSDFNTDDSDYITGLVTADWEDPIDNDNYCAPLNIIQFNASTSSYGSELPGTSDIGISSVSTWVDKIGSAEGIHSTERFIGTTAGNDDGLCTPKTVASLSGVSGTCPDAPRLGGTYNIAGLAYYARNNILRSDPEDTKTVKTYGVALASATPSATVPVPRQQPGEDQKFVNILPACVNDGPDNNEDDGEGNCAIVDFKVIDQEHTGTINTGTLYVNWEGAEQGSDYDSDMWGTIEYTITAGTVNIETFVPQGNAGSSSRALGFGYVISGTQDDGIHFHSGMNNFQLAGTDCENNSCTHGDDPSSKSFNIGDSTASLIRSPLYYAAKWGGYADGDLTEDDIAAMEEAENYFFATDPRELQESLSEAFARVAASVGSSSSVATDSTRLTQGSLLYQARFNSENWTGEVRAYEFDPDTGISNAATFTTDQSLDGINPNTRDIYTVNPDNATLSLVDFSWSNLSGDQQDDLTQGNISGQQRLQWVRGNSALEGAGGLRERDKIMGDIVNSSPAYFGYVDEGSARLPGEEGTDYVTFLRGTKQNIEPTLFVGANDGMLHALYAESADDSSHQGLQERFAYIPLGAYPYLADLSRPNYGSSDNSHRYTVDGPITLRDAYIDGDWATVLVGTMGAGGKGLYALDVTDPDNPEVIFDYTGEGHDDDLGYIMGSPVIARMSNGKWMVVFGNGYQSTNEEGYLYAIDLESPSLDNAVKIKADDGDDDDVSTGLSGPTLLPDANGIVYRAYAGDLMGNMWRFDLVTPDGGSSDNWDLGLDDEPLFVARDGDSDGDPRQPITSAPALGLNDEMDTSGSINVYFGTGKYLDQGDSSIGYTNSFYAIADTGSAVDVAESGYDRSSKLYEKTLSVDGQTNERSITGDHQVSWSETGEDVVLGWYMDFDAANNEGLVQKPSLLFDRLLFATIQPSVKPCEFGGTSWLMEAVAVGNRFGEHSLLDEFRETSSMIMKPPALGFLGANTGVQIWSPTSGEFGSEDSPTPGVGDPCEKTPELCDTFDPPDSALGRQSWQQIR